MRKWWRLIISRPIQVIAVVLLTLASGAILWYLETNKVMPQSAIYFLNDIKMPTKQDRVLIFSPHPDDETLGAGGFISETVKRQAEVKIVLVTDGNKHGLKDKRYAEFKKATATLGVKPEDLIFLNFPDGQLAKTDSNQLRQALAAPITNFNPTFLVYPNPIDQHLDHATVGKIVQDLVDTNLVKATEYQYLVHHNLFPQPKKYRPNDYLLPPLELVKFDKEWQRLMLTPQDEQQKEQAVNAYQTQLKVPFLRSLLLSLIRQNELFTVSGVNHV